MAENTYEVCPHDSKDPKDRVVVCKECYIFVRPGENRIIISFEFLASADIIIDPKRRCWIYRPKNMEIDDFFKAKNFRNVPKIAQIQSLLRLCRLAPRARQRHM